MRLTVDQLETYAFCPLLYQAKVRFTQPRDPIIEALSNLVIYLYSRQLEAQYKISWSETVNAWGRIWWGRQEVKDRKQRSLGNNAIIGIQQLYRYYSEDPRLPIAVNFPYSLKINDSTIDGETSIILTDHNDAKAISILEIGPRYTAIQLQRLLTIQCSALMIQQVIQHMPVCIEYIGFRNDCTIDIQQIYPEENFMHSIFEMVTGLVDSIKRNIIYPNTLGCNQCPIQTACSV